MSSLSSLIGSLRYSPELTVNKYQLLSIYSFSYVPSLVVQLERECCFLAVQDSLIGDNVIKSVSQTFDYSVTMTTMTTMKTMSTMTTMTALATITSITTITTMTTITTTTAITTITTITTMTTVSTMTTQTAI